MSPLRKFFYNLAGVAAVLALIQLPYAFAISSVFSNPTNIDTALKTGGVYDNFVPLVLEDMSSKAQDESTKQLLGDQGIKDAITSSVQPGDIQTASQSIVTGVYAWLEGKTNKPEFTVDLSKPAAQATEKLAAHAEQRSASLPTCTLQQLQTVNFHDDLLSIPCLPPGVSPAQIGQRFRDQATQQIDLLKNPTITSAELLGQTNTAQLENSEVPEAYQNLHSSKWVTLMLVVILAVLLIFARRNRWAGARYVGIVLLVAAGILALAIIMYLFGKANVQATDDKIAEIALNTVFNLAGQLTDIVRWFVLGYVVLGVAAIITVRKMTPTKATVEAAPSQPPTATE